MIYISISAFIMGFLFAKIVLTLIDRNLAKRANHQAKMDRLEYERAMEKYRNGP